MRVEGRDQQSLRARGVALAVEQVVGRRDRRRERRGIRRIGLCFDEQAGARLQLPGDERPEVRGAGHPPGSILARGTQLARPGASRPWPGCCCPRAAGRPTRPRGDGRCPHRAPRPIARDARPAAAGSSVNACARRACARRRSSLVESSKTAERISGWRNSMRPVRGLRRTMPARSAGGRSARPSGVGRQFSIVMLFSAPASTTNSSSSRVPCGEIAKSAGVELREAVGERKRVGERPRLGVERGGQVEQREGIAERLLADPPAHVRGQRRESVDEQRVGARIVEGRQDVPVEPAAHEHVLEFRPRGDQNRTSVSRIRRAT